MRSRWFGLFCVLQQLFGMPVGVLRVLDSLFAELVSGEMVFFAVGGSGGGVGVRCQVV